VSDPKVLFLPGASGAASFWHPVGGKLPADWEKVYASWPGLGSEPADPPVSGFDDCVKLVERHLDRPCDLVAQSMGGIVAIRVALRNPQRVRRLVLVATSGGVAVASLGATDWRPSYRSAYPAAARWITDERPDHSDDLRGLAAPTLLLWGAADPISPVAVGEHLLSLLPDAAMHVLDDGTHDLAHEDPEQVAGLILDHLQAKRPRRREVWSSPASRPFAAEPGEQ
jgi:pimeloyl-ACP methyl ester carboxylesterase